MEQVPTHFKRTEQASTDGDCLFSEQNLPVSVIYTKFDDLLREFRPDPNAIQILRDAQRRSGSVPPILVSTESDGTHLVIDGYHRLYAALKNGMESVDCIVANITFNQSAPLREVEVLLNEFDRKTRNRYDTSWFLKEFISYKMGRNCSNYFAGTLRTTWRTKANNVARDMKATLKRKFREREWSANLWEAMKRTKKKLRKTNNYF